MFTSDLKLVEESHKEVLLNFNRELDEDSKFNDKIYRRVWTKPITTFASNYNLFDVSMAPLKEHMFNKCKSQLKVIEAGFHKKALIAQDYGPYQIDCVNMIEYGGGINEKGNAILVKTSKNHKDWFKGMKKIIDNPELFDLLSENLYNTVKDKYSINTVTDTRAEFYKKIVNDVKKETEQFTEHVNNL